MSLRSSGSSTLARAVDPTMSQNNTVRCRRSLPVVPLSGPDDVAMSPFAPSDRAPLARLLPHPPQYRPFTGFISPQDGQWIGNSTPHCVQKRAVVELSVL